MRLIAVSPHDAHGPRASVAFTTTLVTCSETGSRTVKIYDNFFNFSKLILTINYIFCAGDLEIKY